MLEAQHAILGETIAPAIEAVRRQIAALEAQVVAAAGDERRIITALFSDIVGSTALAEKMDPEDWHDAVALIHEMGGRVIQLHNGHVMQYLGDGLLAAFGTQTPSEHDPENAIRAALDLQAGLIALQARLPVPIQIRIGLHTGLVILGEIGSAQAKREVTATGDTMNLASRLQSTAPPGAIAISHATFQHVRGIFDVTPQPPLTVRGKSEPIQTYLVRRVRPRPFRTVTRGVTGIETATIGREAELQQLQSAVTAAFEDRKVIWTQIVGEAGIGKSRLLSDMTDYLASRSEEIGLLKGRAFQGDEQQAFSLVRRIWFDRFQIAEDAPLAGAEAKWQTKFLELRGAGFEEAAHALGLLVGLPFNDSPYIGAMRNDPAQVRGRAIVVSRELLAAIQNERHLVFLLEDLHWADPSSWDYLTQVLLSDGGQTLSHGLFVLAATRPEWNPPTPLLKHPGYAPIPLTSLSDEDCRRLAAELLKRVADVSADVIQLISERSEGVPYYAEEIVNWLIDRGIVDQRSEPWLLDHHRLQESPLPATLQHLLLTRLSSLHAAERVALQRGSIFGRNFWEGGLEALGAHTDRAMLGRLQPRGFIEAHSESTLTGQREWGFHHTLLQQATYESVLKRERRNLHQAAATWIEEQARRAGRLDEFVGSLGEHAERAGNLMAAADWYLRAGERAQAQGAPLEARRYFERVLELVPPTDRARRWPALLAQSDVLSIVGDKESYRSSVAALLDLAHELGDNQQAEAYYRQGAYLYRSSDYRGAVQAYNEALETASRAGNDQLGTLVLGAKVICQSRLGDLDSAAQTASTLLTQAYQIDKSTQARALSNLAVYYAESGDLAKAAQLHREQAALNHQLGDRNREADALAMLGYDYVQLGMYLAGRSPLAESIKILQSIGERRMLIYSQINLGLAYWRSGDHQAAHQILNQIQGELATMGDAFAQAAGRSYLALVQEQLGDTAGAMTGFAQATAIFARIGAQGYAADAQAGLARCAMAQNDLEGAWRHVTETLDYLAQHGTQGMEFPVWAYQTCAEIFTSLGESDRAHQAIEEGYRDLTRRVEKISDPEWGTSFLNNVPEHKAIVDLWERTRSSTVTVQNH